ncbi:hypothetical protein TWF730_009066 [Orbilia blumenaviensis]|uniref:F-box domain-containing protein n=1 Tax=Orbilia blumenaviensis TaxID=1796055 RepID=A0AAV9UX90_9PEZI
MRGSQHSPDAQYIQCKVHRNLSHHSFTHCRPPAPPLSPITPTGLSRLPTELLLQIFSYLLTSSTPIIISDFQKQDVSSTTSSYTNFKNRLVNHYIGAASGLFLADKKISDAALTVLYSSNTFIIKLRVNFTRAFLLSIGAVNRSRVKNIQFGAYSKLSATTWQYNLKREFEKLGSDLQDMAILRGVEYKLEWTHGRDYPVGDIGVNEVVKVERKDIAGFHKKLLSGWDDGHGNVRVDVISTSSSPAPPVVQQQFGILSLPNEILEKILSYCHLQQEVLLSGPHNYFSTLHRNMGAGSLDVILKHHSPCFGYFSLFLASRRIGTIMREIIYGQTKFRVRDRALSILSSVLNEQDFNMIKEVELVLGNPNQERMKFVVLCLKGALWRFIKSGSRVEKVTVKVDRLSVPYLGTIVPLLRELRKKCNLTLVETLGTGADLKVGDSFGLDMGAENNIEWILDDQGKAIWTWSWAQNGWRDFEEVVGREEGERDRVGKVNGLKEKKKNKKGKEKVEEKVEDPAPPEGSQNGRRLSASKAEGSMMRRVSKSKIMLKKWVSDLH